MGFLRFTKDAAVKRLRWVMIGTILFDKLNTLLGQPKAYWQHPELADEVNRTWHYSLARGLPFYIMDSVVVTLLLFLVVSILPQRIALILGFTVIMNRFFGASFWLCYHWRFGTAGPLVYGLLISLVLILWVFPATERVRGVAL